MTDEQHADTAGDHKTEVIPPVTSGEGLPHTKELPVVVADEPTRVTPPPAGDEPTVLTPPPADDERPTEVAVPPAPVTGPPPPAFPRSADVPSASPAAAAAAAPAAAAPAPMASTPAVPSGSRRPAVLVALAAGLVLVVIVGAVALRGRDSSTTAGSSGSSSAAVKLPATITSVDPSGGSGFRRDGTTWRTQTYTSADFGNLKDGVGLLLDLGTAKQVSRVTVNVDGGPVAVELRAGDSGSTSASGYQRVATDPSASGSTTLAVKDDAEHRYWLVWVTRLASAGGGYRAVLQNPTVFGPRS